MIKAFAPTQSSEEEHILKVARGDKRGRSRSVAITDEQMDTLKSREHAISLIKMAHTFDEDINVR